jgi:hypothetical protein
MSRPTRSLALIGVLAAALPALAVDTVIRRGGEFVVNAQTYGNQRRVDVASTAAGEFVVVWQTYPQYVFDIRAQRYDAAGARKGGEIDVTADSFPQDHPSVGVAADGSFVVVWEDYEYSYTGSLYRIAGRRFGSGGSPVGPEFKVNVTDGTYYNTSVAVAPAGTAPVSLKPTTFGISMLTGWPSMAASASIPPTPQPKTPKPLTIVV